MSAIGSNIHRNNVSGSGYTVRTALNNDHYENMKIIEEQARLKRLQENNEYYLKSKQLGIDAQAQRSRD